MTERQQQKTELMYTPICHIPIGEPVKTADGTRAVKFKKPGCKDTEIVPIDTLMAILVHATDRCK